MNQILAWWHLRQARRAATRLQWSRAARDYRRLLRLRPDTAAVWVQLGHALKEARRFEPALGAYAKATVCNPGDADAWFHLAHARKLLDDRDGAVEALLRAMEADAGFAGAIEGLIFLGERERLPAGVQAVQERKVNPVFARSRVAAWQSAFAIPPALPSKLVVPTADGKTTGAVVILRPDTQLHPAAANWFAFAAERTGADVIYCDHIENDGQAWLQPMPDPIWFEDPAAMPPAVYIRGGGRGGASPESLMATAIANGRAAHLPLPLARCFMRPTAATEAIVDDASSPAAIQVVIQTRDRVSLLEPCVQTLRETATRPDLLDIVIVDNRSEETATAALLSTWVRDGVARVLPLDEPFNWSRANNLAAATGDAPLLLFLNNDTESETRGWDDRLRSNLARQDVGVLGAKLLYPDRTIQHAGIIFGMNEGDPIHEGTARPAGDDPMARWSRRRSVAAVTGAWMAMSRKTFGEVGGFDEHLAVAFNDVDLCIAVRSLGRRVVIDPIVVAIHRESMTRGAFLDEAGHKRDRAEAEHLRARWGEWSRHDPGYNPSWARTGHPFDGLRVPALPEILDWLTRSASTNCWAVHR